MSRDVRFTILYIVSLVFSAFFALLFSDGVFAISTTEINKIALWNQAKTCYTSGNMNTTLNGFNGLGDVFKSPSIINTKTTSITLISEKNSGEKYGCEKSFEKIEEITGRHVATPLDLGYNISPEDAGENGSVNRCFAIHFNETSDGSYLTSNTLCITEKNGVLTASTRSAGSHRQGISIYVNDSEQIQVDLYTLVNGTYESHNVASVKYKELTWNEFKLNFEGAIDKLDDGNYTTVSTDGSGNMNTTDIYKVKFEDDIDRIGTESITKYELPTNVTEKDTGIYAINTKMLDFYFGSTNAPEFNNDQVEYVIELSYQRAKGLGVIDDSDCVGSKEEVKKISNYAHYDKEKNKWCAVRINTTNQDGSSRNTGQYVLINEDKRSLGTYGITKLLEMTTKISAGSETLESVCRTAAQEQRQKLIDARNDEYNLHHDVYSSLYKYLASARDKIDDMLHGRKPLMEGSRCADLPSVNPDDEELKEACMTTFENKLAELEDIKNNSNDPNKRADAEVKINKIKELKDKLGYFDDSNGTVVCRSPDDAYGNLVGSTDDTSGTVSAGEAGTIGACYEGTGVLGWIVCPVIELVGTATSWMYEHAVEPALMVKSTLLFADSKTTTDCALKDENGGCVDVAVNGLRDGWSQFRNFANIAFAIAFAVVIFAQVTGFGISNYNIKKILPRLVMVAILVNLSFILCQIAIDLSNILGSTLKTTLEGFSVTGSKDTPVQIIGLFLNGLGLAGATAGGAIAALTLPVVGEALRSFMLPILLALGACLVGVLFFFVVLAARQVGIVILVVLSPIAIVCYALPNTKSLFDKWKKLFTALLVVYPVCGLLMGGGKYVSALLLSMGGNNSDLGFFYTITALLAAIIPFFMIPSLVKGSLALMGNLGAKISNAGNRLGNGARRAIQNNEAYKESQAEKYRRLVVGKNQVKRDRISGRVKENSLRNRARRAIGLGTRTELTNAEKNRRSRAQMAIDKAIGASAEGIAQSYIYDGTADDPEAMGQIWWDAAKRLLVKPDDRNALEDYRAATLVMAKNKSGIEKMGVLSQDLVKAAETSADQDTARRGLRQIATTALDIGGDKIEKKSPIAAERLRNMRKPNMSFGDIEDESLKGAVEGLNVAAMPDISDTSLKRIIDLIRSGKIKPGSETFKRLTSLASGALNDERHSARINEKAKPHMQELADLAYTLDDSELGSDVAVQDAYRNEARNQLVHTSDNEIKRIANRLSSKDIKEQDRQSMLNSIEDTMQAAMNGDIASISESRANQLNKILTDHNRDLTGGDKTKQGRLDQLTGVKIDHPHQTLGEKYGQDEHENNLRRRATADDVASARAMGIGGFRKGDWIEVTRGSDEQGTTFDSNWRRLNDVEAYEAEEMVKREAAEKLARSDADHQAQQNNPNP